MKSQDKTKQQIIIVDRWRVTAEVWMELAHKGNEKQSVKHVYTLHHMKNLITINPEDNFLIIMDIITDNEKIYEGVSTLEWLCSSKNRGRCRVMVFTSITIPYVLKLIVNISPAVLLLKKEPVGRLCNYIDILNESYGGITISPSAMKIISQVQGVTLSPKEHEYLLYRLSGFDVLEVADLMKITYRNSLNYQRRITRRLKEKKSKIYLLQE
ncbi:hypothetical protein FA830_22080 [Escherichia coli]|nr:hypothetical protein [Escherichia coli]EFC0637166.1 hypothetical protein [Escherichia coli]EFC1447913.1 hypothetical protein [Escherichia coli]EFC1600257.1 hypothetical protein [Escherichia coli]EFC1671148.1 hypothetical protein [Escherichia coli]